MKTSIKNLVSETMMAEKEAILNLEKKLDKNFFEICKKIKSRRGKIVTMGIGKSSYVAQKMAATLTSLGNVAVFLHPSDAFHGDYGVLENGDVVIAFSFSGETAEMVKCIRYIKSKFKVYIFAVTGNRASSLSGLAHGSLEIDVKKEGGALNRAPMASITALLVISDLVSTALMPEGFSKEHFAHFHPGGSLGLSLKKVKDVMTVKNIPVVLESSKIGDAVLKINSGKKGIVGIVKYDNKLSGVLTDGDIRRIFLQDNISKNDSVSIIMTKNPKSISEEASLLEALELMEKSKIMNLFAVSKSGKVSGIIHMHDIVEKSIL